MAIRITRNDAGNCINFVGSSNPAYWNACLSAVINAEDSSRVDIINDIRSENDDETQYEFYAVDFNDFADKDNNAFTSAQAMVDYINENANVVGVSGVGADLTDTVVNFRLDQTSTSIIMDNGSAFGVNTIKAVPDTDGTIHIHAIGAGVPNDEQDENDHKHFEKLAHTNVQINGTAVAGGLNDVVNALNELFTVGPFEAVVISDPYSTKVADPTGVLAGYTLEGVDAVDPAGDDLATATKNTHRAGIKSTATISEPGEYFTFHIRGEGQIGFGLIHTEGSYEAGLYSGNATYANPAQYKVGNNQHYGFQFSHHFHPTPNGSWTNYGANTSFVRGPGWYNWESQDEWLAGEPIRVKCGIDENGFIAISTLQDDGTTWVMHARSAYPVPEGSEYHLGVSMYNPSSRLHSAPLVHELEEEDTPTVIGDTSINVFGTATGTLAGGVTVVDSGGFNDGFITAETISQPGEYFEFAANANEDHLVGLFYDEDYNLADVLLDTDTWTASKYAFLVGKINTNEQYTSTRYKSGSSLSIGSSALSRPLGNVKYRAGFDLQGRPTLWCSSDGTTFTASLNLVSAPTGTYRFYWRGLTSGSECTSVTKGQLSAAPTMYFRYIESPDGNYEYPLFATAEEAEYYDQNHSGTTGTGTYHTHTYVDDPTNTTWYMPDTGRIMNGSTPPQDATHTTFQGNTVTYTEITSLTDADLTPPAFSNADITQEEGTAVNIQLQPADTTYTTSVSISPTGSGLVYDSTSKMLQGTLTDVGADTTYTVTVTRANSYGSSTGSFTITATDVAPVATSLTPWTKALDFSGGNERAQQSGSGVYPHPLMMSASSASHGSWVANGSTHSASNARPWAVTCVFKTDGNSSNQHIWNQGEGANSNTSDDNIYLRTDANRRLYFGWGREGYGYNECLIHPDGTNANWQMSTSNWYGVYIAHTGVRLSGGNATAANLSDVFDIRIMGSSNNWAVTGNADTNIAATASNWTGTGKRMDRSVTGEFTIGGRGGNRNFHGKVAACTVNTLRLNTPMPNAAEIEMLITDPLQWQQDYRIGELYRPANLGTNYSNYQIGQGQAVFATQMWLMGDGANDSYSNMIRNQADTTDQNYTKLNMISMVSNDIQTVNIPGLT